MNPDFQRHIQLGRQFFAAMSYPKAAREFEAALKAEPENNYARLFLARCFLNSGREKEARREVETALQSDPNDADAHYMAAFTAKNSRAALAAMGRALELSPHKAEYHGHRAHVLARLGKWTPALESARHATELAPESASTHRQIAGVLLDEAQSRGLNREKRAELALHVAQALEIEPDNALSQGVLARFQALNFEYEDALEKWGEALRLDPTDAYALHQFRKAKGQAQVARGAINLWRVVFRPLPWPLRLPVLAVLMGFSIYWSLFAPRGRGFLSGEPWLFALCFVFCGMMLPLLLRDWLRWVPDRWLVGWLHSLKKPPLR